MDSQKDEQEITLRETLQLVMDKLPSGTISLAEILELMGRDGQLLFCVFLTIPFMVPVSIPGVSTVFGLAILLIGLGLMLDRNPWLPARLLRRRFPSAKLRAALDAGLIWVARLEKISRPRLLGLTHGANMLFVNGLMVIAGGVLLMMPFGFVPFSNTLPGLAVLLLAVGMLQRDGWCVLLGYLTNFLTTVYFAFLLLGGTVLLQKLWAALRPAA
jgi:hypothetical protein